MGRPAVRQNGFGGVLSAGHVVDASEAPAEPMPMPPTRPPELSTVTVGGEGAQSDSGETVALTDRVTSLVSDSGERVILDRPYVFGRDPGLDERVMSGSASPIRLEDPDQLISRVQALVEVTGEGVMIRDAESANGTYLAAPGAPAWTRITTEWTTIPIGWSLRMGKRVFTHVGAETPREGDDRS